MPTTTKRAKLHMTAEWADRNPHMDSMPPGSSHWRCALRYKGRRMTVPFSQGPAISHEPTAHDVLRCLVSDASSAGEEFIEWCQELGFEMQDLRKAQRIYDAVQRQTAALRRLLGDDFDEITHADEDRLTRWCAR